MLSSGGSLYLKYRGVADYLQQMKVVNRKEVRGQMAKHYVKWEYYENGVNGSISGETVNEIIEEIIGIMRKNKITVGTAQRILEDTVSSIVTDTQIT